MDTCGWLSFCTAGRHATVDGHLLKSFVPLAHRCPAMCQTYRVSLRLRRHGVFMVLATCSKPRAGESNSLGRIINLMMDDHAALAKLARIPKGPKLLSLLYDYVSSFNERRTNAPWRPGMHESRSSRDHLVAEPKVPATSSLAYQAWNAIGFGTRIHGVSRSVVI